MMTSNAGSSSISAALEQRYAVLGELGRGTFGRVYKARQISTGQDIALKILASSPDDLDGERHRQRFRREMQLCSVLSHPHIVRLIDSGDEGGLLYAAFEFLPGPTLREVLESEGRLEFAEALDLMSQILDALACAHGHGIVHRDLKPENIIVTKTGLRRNAMVLDFGLAGFTREAAELQLGRLTATNDMLGTPAYAAPEQLRGEPASPRSDLYSWGLLFLECLTGDVVMNGRTAYDAMMKQLGPEPVPLPVWLRDQPLGRLLATVTAKEPARRAVNSATLLTSLDRIRLETPSPSLRGALSPSNAAVEQRQVTVLACGIVIARDRAGDRLIDPEELNRIECARLAVSERIAREEGGTPVRAQPGRLFVVFGYPRARENDARWALRAARRIALEVGRSADEGNRRIRTGARIGVHSGLGVVRMEGPRGDGGDWCHVVGAPLRIASRLEERARVGEILVTESTRVLLHEDPGWDAAGEIDAVETGEARLPIFRSSAERPPRPSAASGRPEMPLVGRAAELAQLTKLWQTAESGEAAVVLLQGEAGIGKSRLLRELRLRVPSAAWLECRCVAEARTSRLRPVVELLGALAIPIQELLARHGFDLATAYPLFAGLLGLPPGPYAPLRLSPEREKELTLNAVLALLTRLPSDGPKVLAFEDVHWADPTTLELLASLAEECRATRAAGLPGGHGLLLVFTARSDFTVSWVADDVTRISLARLGLRDVERMVNAGRCPEAALPHALIERIAERSDGVPLFVEELVHMLATRGPAMRLGEEPLIPSTLRELLAARLDGLSASAYGTVQIAAALGREFANDVLEIIAQREGKAAWIVRQDLHELLEARLLYRRSVANAHVFKHALVRDAAYDSMVESVRRRVHGRIAEVMVEHLPDFAASRPEIIAHHLFHSGDALAASEYWHRAGDQELRRAAYEEAIRHLELGLDALGCVAPGRARDVRELELLITLGTVHLATKGAAVPEVAATFARAQKIYDRVGGDAPPLKIFAGLYSTYATRGDRAATEEILPRFAALASEAREPVAEFTGVLGLGIHAFWRGEHERARAYLDRGCVLYRTGQFHRFVEAYGWDHGLFTFGYSVWNSCIAGRPAEAETLYRELTEIAEASFNPYSVPLALAFGMAAAHLRSDADETLDRARRLVQISNEQRMYLWLAIGQCGCGWALSRQGHGAEGVGQLRQGLDMCRMIGAMTPYAYYLIYLADALLVAGAVEEGLATVEEGLDLCVRDLACVHEPELLRIAGELLRARGDEAAAEVRLRQAVELATSRGAGAWASRSSKSLASLLRARGSDAEAEEVIARATSEFSDADATCSSVVTDA